MRGDITGLVLVGLLLAGIGAETQAPVDKWFDSNGIRLRYIDSGSGVPIILIHGYTRFLESNWVVHGVFADLSKDHRVMAYDMPGHGKSGKAYAPSAYRDMATDPIRLMDHLGINRAHLLGYSMGGGVVAKVAVTHPERLITAILGGHSGYREWEPADEKYYEDSARELKTDVPFRSLVSSPGLTGSKPTEEQIRALSASLAAENDVKALAAASAEPFGARSSLPPFANSLPSTGESHVVRCVPWLVGGYDDIREGIRAPSGRRL